jgi:hypothetical protein
MKKSQTWFVCEQSGRWAAALRVAFARSPNMPFQPQLKEVRSLNELTESLDEKSNVLGLIEVQLTNLADVLNLLSGAANRRPGRFVALLDYSLRQSGGADAPPQVIQVQRIVDVLWEAGVAEVVESPRHWSGLMALANRIENAAGPIPGSIGGQPIETWARSFLPWQDSSGTLA